MPEGLSIDESRAALIARIPELLEARRQELRAIACLEGMRPLVKIIRTDGLPAAHGVGRQRFVLAFPAGATVGPPGMRSEG